MALSPTWYSSIANLRCSIESRCAQLRIIRRETVLETTKADLFKASERWTLIKEYE